MTCLPKFLFEDSFVSLELSGDMESLVACSVFETLLSEAPVFDMLQNLD